MCAVSGGFGTSAQEDLFVEKAGMCVSLEVVFVWVRVGEVGRQDLHLPAGASQWALRWKDSRSQGPSRT